MNSSEFSLPKAIPPSRAEVKEMLKSLESRVIQRSPQTLPTPRISDPFEDWPSPRPELRGDNAEAYKYRGREALVVGPAGSGKTLMALLKIYWACRKWPGTRCLILRQTRASLTESVLVTWERDILGPAHPILLKNPNLRETRKAYRFPNDSVVVVGGLDRPDKTLSSEYELVYINEVTELKTKDAWETLQRALRAKSMPFKQIMGDCNPGDPNHWVKKRCDQDKLCKEFVTTHKDNPYFFDRETEEFTPAGRDYIDGILARMTGARRNRFFFGKWAVAEGLFYGFDPDIHVIGAPNCPFGIDFKVPASWRRCWSIDWGESSPSVLQIWAYDPEGRMFLTRELYQSHLRADFMGTWAKKMLESGEEKIPEAVVCDHDDKKKNAFEKTSGLSLRLADKADRDKGLAEMQTRYDVIDGVPRILFYPNCREIVEYSPSEKRMVGRVAADPWLNNESLPNSTLEEETGYIYDPKLNKDQPIDYNDHGQDAKRYAGRYIDANTAPDPGYVGPTTSIHSQMMRRAGR